jgi:RHS repeat-associated protein
LTNAVAAIDSDYRYAYDFDEIGNRETSFERGANSIYCANNLNQYTAVDDFTPQFDDDGNQTLIKTPTGIWSVTYNGENRPIFWAQGTNTIAMSYDRMGRRVMKNNQRFVYNGYLQIADSNGNAYIWDPTEPIATRPLVWQHGDSVLYYAHDGNKNVSEVVSDENEISAHYEYAPFGVVALAIGDFALLNSWRFSSEYFDDETDTVYYIFRHLDTANGRWLTRDVVDEVGGANLYGFCFNYCFDNDFCGCIVDTIWDVASIIWDVGKLSVGLVTNNPTLVGEATVDLAADTVAAIIPGVPAGATKMLRIAKQGTGTVVNKVCSATVKTRLTRRVTIGIPSSVGQIRSLRGKEFQTAVSNYFKEDIVVSETMMVLKRADGSVLKAELDITLNNTVFELKNWDRITPSGAQKIIYQIQRQQDVIADFYGQGIQHGGLLISQRTKMSNRAIKMFKDEGISVKRAEFLEGEIKAFIDISK